MTFIADETSVQDGRPVELYTFVIEATTVRLAVPVTYVYDSNTYTASPIERGNIERDGVTGNPHELTISLPANEIGPLLFGLPPPRTFTVQVNRVQPSGAQDIWRGSVSDVKLRGRKLELRCAGKTDDLLHQQAPSWVLQPTCSHVLFDNHCRADRVTHSFLYDVVSVSGDQVTLDGIAQPSGFFNGGEFEKSGVWRTIFDHTGDVLTLDAPFPSVTGTVTLYRPCDRSVLTCRDTFANVVNFGGFPFVPVQNLHRTKFHL